MILPDSAGSDGELTVREWRPADAGAMADALSASREHLAPWMEWATEPTLSTVARVARFHAWSRRRLSGGDVIYGIFLDGQVAGGTGFHRRLGPEALEIGYWVAAGFTRRGVATRTCALLCDTAFTLEGISRVEIHHDVANLASAGVPAKLGFSVLGESPDAPTAPGEAGIERRWGMTREAWLGGLRARPGAGSG